MAADNAMDGCLLSKDESPTCNEPESTFPMVLVRGMNSIGNHLAFRAPVFANICTQVCNAPRYERFKDGFCSHRYYAVRANIEIGV